MMITIANPIYDAVFKYLMEDERIARTILSALLKKNIVSIETRKHEYANGERDKISMFRIDFAATIREADESEHLVLIELQKTWVETETLRFRQYLGAQYSNPDNMLKDGTLRGRAIPMVSVYLLGHRVGDIEEPVLYVSHGAYDYNGKAVTRGIPDPFVESLVHDSIIVQIPLLRGRVNSRLYELLSVFDQSRRDPHNGQTLLVDEQFYDSDDDLHRIVHRLGLAAASAKMRHHMNVEDEYFSAIENRDTALMQLDRQLAETTVQLKEKEEAIAENEKTLAEKDEALLQSAKAMKAVGMTCQQIADVTHLPLVEIECL